MKKFVFWFLVFCVAFTFFPKSIHALENSNEIGITFGVSSIISPSDAEGDGPLVSSIYYKFLAKKTTIRLSVSQLSFDKDDTLAIKLLMGIGSGNESTGKFRTHCELGGGYYFNSVSFEENNTAEDSDGEFGVTMIAGCSYAFDSEETFAIVAQVTWDYIFNEDDESLLMGFELGFSFRF